MPRKPRVQFPNAIYHIVTRGDGKQKLFHDDGHYQRFTEGLEAEVLRSGWQVIAYCWMPHHIHALIKTPEPNLSNGMQHWLSGFANWYAKRNRRKGHLYQGRFKAFQVEDLSYFCTLSRYIHVNPCVGQKPLGENLKLGFIAVTVITLTGDERKIGLRVNCCSTVGKRNTVADIPSPPIAGMSSKNLTSQPQSQP